MQTTYMGAYDTEGTAIPNHVALRPDRNFAIS